MPHADSVSSRRSHAHIYLLIFCSGLAALSWEVVWQIKASLALGVSAWGTSVMLATTMGGMSLGALMMGSILKLRTATYPLRIYGLLEVIVGLFGLSMVVLFKQAEHIDTWVYTVYPEYALITHILSIVLILIGPAWCLGATLPVIGLIARQHHLYISLLYGLNTLGAATGTLVCAFVFMPLMGVFATSVFVAIVNFLVGIFALRYGREKYMTSSMPQVESAAPVARSISFGWAALIVFATGFVTFLLEISWFRSLTAAFFSTTSSFAIMLSVVLLALGAGAYMVTYLRARNGSIPVLLCYAGISVLLLTPLVERLDYIGGALYAPPFTHIVRFLVALYLLGVPIVFLGAALPWILDMQTTTRRWGALYSLNAVAGIIGALSAAWLFLPAIGFARTAWLAGILVLIVGVVTLTENRKRIILASVGLIALVIAVVFESGLGRLRVQAFLPQESHEYTVLGYYEGPDATVSVVNTYDDDRILVINGFSTSSQAGSADMRKVIHYMHWMGHLPMLMHEDPKMLWLFALGRGKQHMPCVLKILNVLILSISINMFCVWESSFYPTKMFWKIRVFIRPLWMVASICAVLKRRMM